MSGLVSVCAGRAAEDTVARWYESRGGHVLARRWRGAGGEIDLIVAEAGSVVFVEVKQARTLASAALRITAAQRRRIWAAAERYLDGLPNGTDSDARIDVALVARDGGLDIIENAFF